MSTRPKRLAGLASGSYGPIGVSLSVLLVFWLICFWLYRQKNLPEDLNMSNLSRALTTASLLTLGDLCRSPHVMRTVRQCENYVLELEWRHLTDHGNAGLLVHSEALPATGLPFTRVLEIQVLLGEDDPKGNWTGHGDVFAIQDASFVPNRPHPGGWMRRLPSKRRVRGTGLWNQGGFGHFIHVDVGEFWGSRGHFLDF